MREFKCVDYLSPYSNRRKVINYIEEKNLLIVNDQKSMWVFKVNEGDDINNHLSLLYKNESIQDAN